MFDDIIIVLNKFKEEGLENPLLETLRLFDFISGGIIGGLDIKTLKDYNHTLDSYIEKRKGKKPLEYIFQEAIFMNRRFYCTSQTLIPTPRTKNIVDKAIEILKKNDSNELVMLDIGTGCGNIAICIALKVDNLNVYASDISDEAIRIADKNIRRYNLQNIIKTRVGNLFDPFSNENFKEKIDVIICNPPYIPTKSIKNLSSEINQNQPRLALDGGPFGIDIFVKLIEESLYYLKKNGKLLIEIGENQDRIVSKLIFNNGRYKSTEIIKDKIIYGFLLEKL